VIVDGAYALHSTLRSLLDIRVAVVNTIFALLSLNPFLLRLTISHYGNNIGRVTLHAFQVGGVHFSLLSKVQHDIGDSCSLDYLIDSIFPLFRKHIEPDLHHAQVHALFTSFCF
jgi:hypothetical protein